jgi:hypothetical protein
MKEKKPITIAVDFDGTVVSYAYPDVGQDIGSQKVLKSLIEKGHKLILNTMRSGQQLEDAVKWFKENDIELFGVQEHPTQHTWTESRKCYANLYVDDSAVGIALKTDVSISPKPFVDWDKLETTFEEMGLI